MCRSRVLPTRTRPRGRLLQEFCSLIFPVAVGVVGFLRVLLLSSYLCVPHWPNLAIPHCKDLKWLPFDA